MCYPEFRRYIHFKNFGQTDGNVDLYHLKQKHAKMLQRNFRILNNLKNLRTAINPIKSYGTKPEESTDVTHFGYETVKTKDKTEKGNKFVISAYFQ